MNDIVRCLVTVPATDGNFISALNRASGKDLLDAIYAMEQNGGKNKTRMLACSRELRRRAKL